MVKKLMFFAAMLFYAAMYAQEPAEAVVEEHVYSEGADLLCTANTLVRYGYKTKSALPLIQAIEIYNSLGVSEDSGNAIRKREIAQTESIEANTTDISFEISQLIETATKYADGNKNILALIESIGHTRGAKNGPVRVHDFVPAGGMISYEFTLRGRELSTLILAGGFGSKLGLILFDETGKRLHADESKTEDCYLMFTPQREADYIVNIVNYGNSDCKIAFAIN